MSNSYESTFGADQRGEPATSYPYADRSEYFETQIRRFTPKFGYCKVYLADVLRYRQLLLHDRHALASPAGLAPILCLGVRSGAEIDLFRAGFFSPLVRLPWARTLATRLDNSTSAQRKMWLSRLLWLGRTRRNDSRVMGVEINPLCQRPDVYVGSFDDLPQDWSARFGLLFSNSLDHTMDIERTTREWKRVARPGAYVILAYNPGQAATASDPTGNLSLRFLCELWDAELVFASESFNRNNFHEVCFRL